jgi:hypothetical protein
MEGFFTTLKYKRQEFSVADLIESIDVEEKARERHLQEISLVF